MALSESLETLTQSLRVFQEVYEQKSDRPSKPQKITAKVHKALTPPLFEKTTSLELYS